MVSHSISSRPRVCGQRELTGLGCGARNCLWFCTVGVDVPPGQGLICRVAAYPQGEKRHEAPWGLAAHFCPARVLEIAGPGDLPAWPWPSCQPLSRPGDSGGCGQRRAFPFLQDWGPFSCWASSRLLWVHLGPHWVPASGVRTLDHHFLRYCLACARWEGHHHSSHPLSRFLAAEAIAQLPLLVLCPLRCAGGTRGGN